MKGREDLDKWNDQRKKEREETHRQNMEQEKLYHEQVKAQRGGANPWERVISNCDMNSSSYPGGADVTRMRQAMINRKSDITKGGASVKLFAGEKPFDTGVGIEKKQFV